MENTLQLAIFTPLILSLFSASMLLITPNKYEAMKSRLSSYLMVISLVTFIFTSFNHNDKTFSNIIISDSISTILTILILFISSIVHFFSIRYMFGEKKYNKYYIYLSLITSSLILLVNSNNFYLFFFSWVLSNLFLLKLLGLKSSWSPANQSSALIGRFFFLGFACLFIVICFLNLNHIANFSDLKTLLNTPENLISNNQFIYFSLISLILICSLIQCSLIPFHGYLLNSLNAPTPVSALMHASLVNGGGFLLIRFSPIFINDLTFLNFIFIFGFLSAFFGVLWMLTKVDIKGLLASSTISQMGFMFIQIGLGLFPIAISHLCMHGIFKSYLFLSSGSALNQLSSKNSKKLSITANNLFHSLLSSLIATIIFSALIKFNLDFTGSKTLFLGFVFLFLFDISINIISLGNSQIEKLYSYIAVIFISSVYGNLINFIDLFLEKDLVHTFVKLETVHYISFSIFLLTYIIILLKDTIYKFIPANLIHRAYVFIVNSSQPNIETSSFNREATENA